MRNTTDIEDWGESENTDARAVPADDRCRFVLADLLRHARPVPVYDLTDRLSSWGAANGVEGLERASFRRVRERLVEEYLPPLVEAGLVERVDGGRRYVPTDAGVAAETAARGLDRESRGDRSAPYAIDGDRLE
jgi:hypothetical protein